MQTQRRLHQSCLRNTPTKVPCRPDVRMLMILTNGRPACTYEYKQPSTPLLLYSSHTTRRSAPHTAPSSTAPYPRLAGRTQVLLTHRSTAHRFTWYRTYISDNTMPNTSNGNGLSTASGSGQGGGGRAMRNGKATSTGTALDASGHEKVGIAKLPHYV